MCHVLSCVKNDIIIMCDCKGRPYPLLSILQLGRLTMSLFDRIPYSYILY